jgi:hypothetical protein
MKSLMLAFLLLFSLSCFGMKKYILPKEDFLKQFSNGAIPPTEIYCFREDGSKVWLIYRNNSIMTIQLTSNGKKEVILPTVTLKDSLINAREYNVWIGKGKSYTVNINDVQSFYIETKAGESIRKFVDTEDGRKLAEMKNDSLKHVFDNHEELLIRWVPKGKGDTLYIREHACYHMEFKDQRATFFGIVQKITKDSIYISSAYNEEWAAANKKTYAIYGYAIQDISQLNLLKSGGFTYRKAVSENYNLGIIHLSNEHPPFWYSVNPGNGKVVQYTYWLTDRGYIGVMHENGRMYW